MILWTHSDVMERYKLIAQKRLSGMTLKQIAHDEGISIGRVQQILIRYERKTDQRIEVNKKGLVKWTPKVSR